MIIAFQANNIVSTKYGVDEKCLGKVTYRNGAVRPRCDVGDGALEAHDFVRRFSCGGDDALDADDVDVVAKCD